jgi:hypothetical protein
MIIKKADLESVMVHLQEALKTLDESTIPDDPRYSLLFQLDAMNDIIAPILSNEEKMTEEEKIENYCVYQKN